MHKHFPTAIFLAVLLIASIGMVYFFKEAGTGKATFYETCVQQCMSKIPKHIAKGTVEYDLASMKCQIDCQKQQPRGGTTTPAGLGGPSTSSGGGSTGISETPTCPEGKPCDDGDKYTCDDKCDESGACKGTKAETKLCGDLACGYYSIGCKDNIPTTPDCTGCISAKLTCSTKEIPFGRCEKCTCVEDTTILDSESYAELCRKCAPKDTPKWIEKCIEVGGVLGEAYGYAGSPTPTFDDDGKCTGLTISWDLMKIFGKK